MLPNFYFNSRISQESLTSTQTEEQSEGYFDVDDTSIFADFKMPDLSVSLKQSEIIFMCACKFLTNTNVSIIIIFTNNYSCIRIFISWVLKFCLVFGLHTFQNIYVLNQLLNIFLYIFFLFEYMK